MKGEGRLWKVKEGHGWSFSATGLTFQVRKVMDGWDGVVVVVCRTLVSQSQSFSFGLWNYDLGLGFGTRLGTRLGLDIFFI